MNKKTKVLLAIIIIAFALCVACLFIFSQKGEKIVVTQDGEVLYVLDLGEDREIKIGNEDSYNILKIENGEAYITKATCHDKVCVSHGPLKSKTNPIVCLPNKVIISFWS